MFHAIFNDLVPCSLQWPVFNDSYYYCGLRSTEKQLKKSSSAPIFKANRYLNQPGQRDIWNLPKVSCRNTSNSSQLLIF